MKGTMCSCSLLISSSLGFIMSNGIYKVSRPLLGCHMYGGLASFGDSYLNLCHGKGSANKDRHKPAVFANLVPLVVKVGMPNIRLSRSTNARAVSDAPHYKSAGRFGKPCGARPIQLFEGSRPWGGIYAN